MTELNAIIAADILNNTANLDGSPLPILGPDIFDHVANLVGLSLPDSDAAANQVADISDHAANQMGSTLPDIGAAANQVADILDHAVRSTLPDTHNIADNGDVVVANMWSDSAYLAANTTPGRCIFNNAANFTTTTNLVESIRPAVVYNILRREITTLDSAVLRQRVDDELLALVALLVQRTERDYIVEEITGLIS